MLYVFDLDGVIYRMDEPVPGAVETIHRLRNRGDKITYLTNTSSRTREDYVAKRASLGIPAAPEEIMTFCRGQIAHYKIPRYIKFVDTFPTTVTGKVQKFVMRDLMIAELGLREEKTA